MILKRLLNLPKKLTYSMFLWGPRQVGKSYYLKHHYPEATYIDLLRSADFIKYAHNPTLLGEELRATPAGRAVIIDEIQKVPLLLDEVHSLIEDRGIKFILCGSSARKLRSGQANLLGGRALRYEMFGLVVPELAEHFDLVTFCNRGNIPNHYLSEQYWDLLESYVSDYLKEEILAEALVKKLPAFGDFLRAASICDTEILNYTNVASDCGVSSATVKTYYDILCDTLQGSYLPAYVRRPKRKVIHSPKFYFANVGVVNKLAKRRLLEPGAAAFGKAFENMLFNEVRAWNSYNKHDLDLAYWKLADGGNEVDLVIEELGVAIEFKSSENITPKHLAGLNELQSEQPKFTNRMLVSLTKVARVNSDGIRIYNYREFLDKLWSNDLFK